MKRERWPGLRCVRRIEARGRVLLSVDVRGNPGPMFVELEDVPELLAALRDAASGVRHVCARSCFCGGPIE